MSSNILADALVGLLPVLSFLAALLYLDSYKLVKLRAIITIVAGGAIVAGISYLIDGYALDLVRIDLVHFSRYVAPFTEELLKGLVIVVLIRTHRIGFLVDAAIFGVMSLGLLERAPGATVRALLPGYVVAVVLHSGFNHLLASPTLAMLAILVVLPPLLYLVFQRSERAVGDWLGKGFDADTEMLELINSGRLSDSPVGEYLGTLKSKFKGPLVADLLCYLRLYTELALRAKGILIMRESGFDVPVDEETRAKFTEMRYLESSIGKTGLLAIQPMCHMNHRELWQLYMLGK